MPSTSIDVNQAPVQAPVPVESPLSIADLTSTLIKHYALHEGFYDLLVEFHIGVGSVGPNPASPSPGAMIAISKIGLVRTTTPGPNSTDARLVNPAKRPARKKAI